MKKRIGHLCLLLALSVCLTLVPARAEEPSEEPAESRGYIVSLRPGAVMPFSAGADAQYLGLNMYLVDSLEDAYALAGPGAVEGIGPNFQVELFGKLSIDDPVYVSGKQWSMDFLELDKLWGMGLTGEGVRVAVVDTGFAVGHEDQPVHLLKGYNATLNPEHAGYRTVGDSKGHGSLVVSTLAAATNNGLGAAGAAPDVELLPVQILNASGSMDVAFMIAGINVAVEAGAKVINVSAGITDPKFPGSYTDVQLKQAVDAAVDKGCIVVAAAGNEGAKASTLAYPAAYDNVVGVAAVDRSGVVAAYSTHNESVWVAAPGSSMYGIDSKGRSSYRNDDGTSFAAPCISALAALAKQYDPDLTAAQFKNLLRLTSVDKGKKGYDYYYGYGVVSGSGIAKALPQRSISYELNGGAWPGGTTPPDSFLVYQDEDVSLPQPQRTGYAFGGWYATAALSGEAVTELELPALTADVTYYARWLDANHDLNCVALRLDGEEYPFTLNDAGAYELYLPSGTDVSAATVEAVTVSDAATVSTAGPVVDDDAHTATWTVTVTPAGGAAANYTAVVDTSLHAPAFAAAFDGSCSAAVIPASLDAATPVRAWNAQADQWFTDADGDALTYAVSDVAVSGTTVSQEEVPGLTATEAGALSFTPATADAGKTISFTVTASDGRFTSPAARVTITVGSLPLSQPTLDPGTGRFDRYPLSEGYLPLRVAVQGYDNTLTGLSLNGVELVRGKDYTQESSLTQQDTVVTLHESWLETLDTGNAELSFHFATGRQETPQVTARYVLTVTDSTPKPPVLTPAKGSFDRYSGGAAHRAVSFTYPADSPELTYVIGTDAYILTADTDYLLRPGSGATTVTLTVDYLSSLPKGDTRLKLYFDDLTVAGFTVTVTDTTPVPTPPPEEGTPSGSGGGSSGGGGGGSSGGGGGGGGGVSSGGSSGGGGGGGGGGSGIQAKPMDTPVVAETPAAKVETRSDGSAQLTLGQGESLSDEQKAAVAEANAKATVRVTANGSTAIIPAGTLSSGSDVAGLLIDANATGNVVVRITPEGEEQVVALGVVENGKAVYVADEPGRYTLKQRTVTYTDTQGHWAGEAIAFVSARELCRGVGDQRFAPDVTVSRAMVFTVLANLSHEAVDGAGTRWYDGAVAWAVEQKLSDGTRPEEAITRQELMTLLWRWAGSPKGGDLDRFPDAGDVASWAKEAVAWAAGAGIVKGNEHGAVVPNSQANRSELAALLQRFVTGQLQAQM